MGEFSFITAFVGGVLALLSPCAALLLPAFFSSTVGSKLQMLWHGAVFYIGLLITLVPIGLGIGALGSLMQDHWGVLVVGTSLLLIAFGLAQLFGKGFDLAKLAPGQKRLQKRAEGASGIAKTLLLGSVSGVAGFCAGPILGAILTLAMTQNSLWGSGFLLALYGLGMVVPLVIIAMVWHKISDRGMKILRGRVFSLGGFEFHTTSVITGILIITVGLVFYFTNGLIAAPALVPSSWLADAQTWVSNNPVKIQLAGIVSIAATALIWWYFRNFGESRTAQSSVNNTPTIDTSALPAQPKILREFTRKSD